MFDKQQFGSSRQKVIFFIGGYRTRIATYAPLYWIMNLLGYQIYAYVLDSKMVVASNIKTYVGQVQAVQQDIAATLSKLPKNAKAYTMGNSLGSESALYALKHTPQLKAAVLVTARGSIARYIWRTTAGQRFKPAYEDTYDFTRLAREVESVEPLNELDRIGTRPVYMYYSDADKVIPVANTKLLIKGLQNADIHLKIRHYRHIGHFVAAFAGLGAFWRWHRFFNKEG